MRCLAQKRHVDLNDGAADFHQHALSDPRWLHCPRQWCRATKPDRGFDVNMQMKVKAVE